MTLLPRLPFRHHFALVDTLTSALAVGLAGLGTQALAVSVFSGAAVGTVESGQTVTSLTFTVSGLVDVPGDERVGVDNTSFDLFNGNSACGTTVLSGGLFFLSGKNGPAVDTVLSGGGILEMDSPKATISGSLTFEGGHNTLDIAVVATLGSGGEFAVMTGFSSTDRIDISAFGSGATLSFASSGGNEDVTDSGPRC